METKTLEQTAKTLMARAEIFGCSYKTAWEYHMLKEEKQGFEMLEVFEEVRNQAEKKFWKINLLKSQVIAMIFVLIGIAIWEAFK